MLEKRLTNVLSDYTSLSRKKNRLCVFGKEIKSKDDQMKRAEDRNYEKEDGDCEGKDKRHKR